MSRRSVQDLLGDDAENVVALPRKVPIARGDSSNLGLITTKQEVTWAKLCAELSAPHIDRKHSHDAFMSLDKATRDDLKSAGGWFVGGTFDGKRRSKSTVVSRSIISIDIDDAPPSLMRKIERGEFKVEFFAHITRHHTNVKHRIRIHAPTEAPIPARDYPRAARALAMMFVPDLEGVDPGSFEAERLMYLPTVSRDQEYWHHKNAGPRFIPPAPVQHDGQREMEGDGEDLAAIAHNRKFFRDVAELRACVASIVNDESIDRAAWFKILGAICFESDGSDEGFEIAEEFSGRWVGGDHDEEHFAETWASIKRGQSQDANRKFATGRYLFQLAVPNGYRRPIEGQYPLDEEGVCRAFEDAHKDQLRHDEDRGFWFVMQNGVWRPRGDRYAYHWARLASVDIAQSEPGTASSKALRKARTWSAVENASRRVPAFHANAAYWDPDPFLLGTPGGAVDLRTGELREAVAADRITRLTAVAPIPLDTFDPERDCPRWLDFLDDVCGEDRALIRFLRQYVGYGLTGDVSEHKLIFIFGAGRNGKGTLQDNVRRIMGDYAVVANMATFAETKYDRHLTELASLAGARLVVASETEEGRAWAEARLKACTGGDPITARFMRQDEFTYDPQFKLLFIGNHKPNLHSVDDAIKARVNIVPFTFKPERPDKALGAKLRREWPGILSWMIKGCLDWQKNGLVIPEVVKEANAAYFRDQDTLGRWIEECCECGPAFVATTGDLFDSYAHYAGLRGDIAVNKNKSFPDELGKRGFESIKNKHGIRGRGWRGVRLKTDAHKGDFD